MTAQIAENLRYDGQDLSMCTNPLSDFFAMGGADPGFRSNSTALWRGYVGSWEIVDGRLYLVNLDGTLRNGREASMATIFPAFPGRVFAHWYSGTIRVPQGKQIEYVHMGYGSIHERDLYLEIEKGVITNTRVRQNGTSKTEGAAEGYRIGGWYISPYLDKFKKGAS